MADEDHKGCAGKDVLFPGPTLPDGSVPFVRHRGNHDLEVGVMSRVPAGEEPPPDKETLVLRGSGNPYYEVVECRKPAMVNSEAFKTGWEHTFGGRRAVTGVA